jgi:broad specificity phosphatase PhoE
VSGTHVWLIRHAEALVNVERRVAGPRCDSGLTPQGVAQAEALRARLEAAHEFTPRVLISSTLPRARQTALLLAPAFGLEPTADEGLCEMHPGEAEGLTFEECEARYGAYDPRRPISPGGERWQTFVRRVGRTLGRLVEAHAGHTLALVAHGWVIEASFVHFFALPNPRVPRLEFQVTHTSLTHWYERRRPAGARFYLGRYNDAAHLQKASRWQT